MLFNATSLYRWPARKGGCGTQGVRAAQRTKVGDMAGRVEAKWDEVGA
ncbi:hypothetical protein Ari01nite_43570 [Paractinoplanes rishiriensis]|uniref:Uncharacterized protein n=1 Tax=Paractinoplanes rishiriensis TaxID=1050105 RepID=A0A919N1G9_9ACTN|nr:hypothetical protein Ari01nite_43570 [Actinoplanes rishiriensis]